MIKFKYSRRLHILALLALLLISVVNIVVLIVSPEDEEIFGTIGLMVVILVWMVFWWLRGSEALIKWFPLFHYITLIIELLTDLFKLLYAVVRTLKLVFAMMNAPFSIWEPVNLILQVLVFLVYVLLVYILAPVPYVLLKGSEEDKDAQDREVRSNLPIQPIQDAAPAAEQV